MNTTLRNILIGVVTINVIGHVVLAEKSTTTATEPTRYMDNPAVEKVEVEANTPPAAVSPVQDIIQPTVEVVKPAPKTYKFTAEEAKMQYSFFYNLGRQSGPGHLDTRYNAERQLASHGFPPVDVEFIKTVRECYDNTGDAYCWDR